MLHLSRFSQLSFTLAMPFALFGCNEVHEYINNDGLSTEEIRKLIPSHVNNRKSWATDISKIYDELKLTKNTQNICTAIAVIDQESNFVADPRVPNLGNASLKAIDDKLEGMLGKQMAGVFRQMLETRPTPQDSFIKQVKRVKTEKELDELYRKIFDYFSSTYKVAPLANITKLSGQGIDERINPVTTLGSMQVHIDYARQYRRTNMSDRELRSDLYSQYGGLYYGIHRLMVYQADYDKPLYRFADYNSGMYSSRNAAFQQRISTLTGETMEIDGDLLLYSDGSPALRKSHTETVLIDFLAKHNKGLSDRQIRSDLRKEKSKDFETTRTYQEMNEIFVEKFGRTPSYAIMPKVVISGPKLNNDYNTNWYASNVDRRYQSCMNTAKRLRIS